MTDAEGVLYPPKSILAEWQKAITVLEALALTFSREISPEAVEDYLDQVLGVLELFYDYFGTQRLHLWRRRRLVKMIKETSLDEDALLALAELRNSLPEGGGHEHGT